jgi:hypothetical protein
LDHLKGVQSQDKSRMALPREVNRWWRDRSYMRLTRQGNEFKVTGHGSERARVAHASLSDRGIIYRLHGAIWTITPEEPLVAFASAAFLCSVLVVHSGLFAPAVLRWARRRVRRWVARAVQGFKGALWASSARRQLLLPIAADLIVAAQAGPSRGICSSGCLNPRPTGNE